MSESHEFIAAAREGLSAAEVEAIATLGYIYGYPLVLMDVTRSLSATPVNRFTHADVLPDDRSTDVIRPDVDTLYSTAWLELSREPVVLAVPEVDGRYYTMQLLDAWTNVFAAPGTRTTGNGAGAFAIVGPGWRGNVPASVEAIQAPTNMVRLIGRTATTGAGDYDAVHAIQRGYQLFALSQWGKAAVPVGGASQAPAAAPPPPAPAAAPPSPAPGYIDKLNAEAFLSHLAGLMKSNPPAAYDEPLVRRLMQLGVVPGEPFDLARLPASLADAVESGVAAARARIAGAGASTAAFGSAVDGWRAALDAGRYGTNYERRARGACAGLGANLAEDVVSLTADADAAGTPLSGAHRYVIRFAPAELPPARAFWSITIYDDRHLLVPNPLRRHALGDRDTLRAEPDGTVEILIQRDDPGPERRASWLPAPPEAFALVLRLYHPRSTVLTGGWRPPAIVRA